MDNEKIIELHSQGLWNNEIARRLGISRGIVKYRLSKLGLEPNIVSRPIEIVSEGYAKCKTCKEVKPIEKFQYGRKGRWDEYKFSYCNECRRKQIYYQLNNNFESYLHDRFNKIKRNALKNGYEFSIDFSYAMQLWENQDGKCFYTDIKLSWGVGGGLSWNSLSFDKIIPSYGYVKGNVVFCSRRINVIKNNVSLDEMKKWMPGWYKRIIEKWNNEKNNHVEALTQPSFSFPSSPMIPLE